VEPRDTGYRVIFDRIHQGRLIRGEESAARVFLAAGSLGTTELLLRCRDEYRTLPNLSPALGRTWSANGNVLSMTTYPDDDRVQQGVGPTISAVMDFMDGAPQARFVVEDDGFPNVLLSALRAALEDSTATAFGRSLLERIEEHVRAGGKAMRVMVWLGAGVDAADGAITLKRPFLAPWTRVLDLRWTPESSRGVVEAIMALHRSATEITGGEWGPDALWGRLRSLVTLHPLGGCRMGVTPETGVVDHLGQVFGYRGLYVVDGSIVPTALGRNPSHTIAALAERIAAHVR
jgi:cholesterol oxidase